MFKKKEVVTLDTHIEGADKEYAAAVSLFENAKAKVEAANLVLNNTDADIDAQVEALLAKKKAIGEQRERNNKFAGKLGEFLG